MGDRLGQLLLTAEEIRGRVRELGAEISRDYEGEELLLVGVLKGAVVFLADLMRAISIPGTCDFIGVGSYGVGKSSSGVVQITSDLPQSVEGKNVLLVEDIVDTGRTIRYLKRNLQTRQPASLKICALLDKIDRREVELTLDYVGFRIPNEFVVGYGLDYAGLYRNLPYVAVLETD